MNSVSSPLVSILTTSYNHGKYVGQTVESVLNQSYSNIEFVIADDCSQDNSLEVIRQYKSNKITLLTANTNQGASVTYARAYAHCHGKYLISLDSDDYMHVDRVQKQVEYLEAHTDIDILGTYIHEAGSNNNSHNLSLDSEKWFNCSLDLNDPASWIWQNHLNHSSVMMRLSAHELVGAITESLIYAPDFDFWLRCLALGRKFHVIPEQLTYYRTHGDNITHRHPAESYLETVYCFNRTLKPLLQNQGKHEIIESFYQATLLHPQSRVVPAMMLTKLLLEVLREEKENRPFLDFKNSLKDETFLPPNAAIYPIVQNICSDLYSVSDRLVQQIANSQRLEKELIETHETLRSLVSSRSFQAVQSIWKIRNSFKRILNLH